MTSQLAERHGGVWPVQDAKARFSELLDTCIDKGPQTITRRGIEAAVLVPVEEWRRSQEQQRPTLKQLLLSQEGRFEIDLPPRGQASWRGPQSFED
ncbi:MAG: type II toxin-antitoxin system Phd/YefM family antitoxin [Bifidobacteriaceae bacterium]|jgi:prevent-host-death family protein|nr:type II toxin-antitoxin system Phd/YefM family antitoxin [Bifidobacteriaceae bacterium]